MNRRDMVNQHGAKVPTETTAIRNIETEESALATARRVYGIIVRTCCLADFHLNTVEIEKHGYKFTEEDFTR